MSRFSLLLATMVALFGLNTVSAQTCGGAGYDLSALANMQFSYFDPRSNFTYSTAPCGVVTNATACPTPNLASTSFCQAGPGQSGTSLAQYSAANATWYASPDGKSVTQLIQDGTSCGSFLRETSSVFMCDSSATTPVLVNATEVHTCYYTAYYRTAAACSVNSNAATGANGGVGSTYFDSRCGAGVYDLSSLATQDLFWTPNASAVTTVWFLRPCGSVSNANCSATAGQGGAGIPSTQTAMLCQSDQTDPSGNDNAASFYVAGQQLWTITSTGLSMQIQDGESCGSYNRETMINYVCNPSATTAVLSSVTEAPTCYYTATVQTSLVCGGPKTTPSGSSTGGVVTASSSGGVSNPVGTSSSAGGAPVTPGGNNGAASTSASLMVAALVAVVALLL